MSQKLVSNEMDMIILLGHSVSSQPFDKYWSLTVTLTVLLLLYLLLFSDASICSTMAFPPLGNSNHVVVSVSIDFLSNSRRDAPFHHITYDFLC